MISEGSADVSAPDSFNIFFEIEAKQGWSNLDKHIFYLETFLLRLSQGHLVKRWTLLLVSYL